MCSSKICIFSGSVLVLTDMTIDHSVLICANIWPETALASLSWSVSTLSMLSPAHPVSLSTLHLQFLKTPHTMRAFMMVTILLLISFTIIRGKASSVFRPSVRLSTFNSSSFSRPDSTNSRLSITFEEDGEDLGNLDYTYNHINIDHDMRRVRTLLELEVKRVLFKRWSKTIDNQNFPGFTIVLWLCELYSRGHKVQLHPQSASTASQCWHCCQGVTRSRAEVNRSQEHLQFTSLPCWIQSVLVSSSWQTHLWWQGNSWVRWHRYMILYQQGLSYMPESCSWLPWLPWGWRISLHLGQVSSVPGPSGDQEVEPAAWHQRVSSWWACPVSHQHWPVLKRALG